MSELRQSAIGWVMLKSLQKYARANSYKQTLDGSAPVYFAPEQPEGAARGNRIQTGPNKGWFTS